MKKVRTGFTLIELIFVIVILSILSAVAIPKIIGMDTNGDGVIDEKDRQVVTKPKHKPSTNAELLEINKKLISNQSEVLQLNKQLLKELKASENKYNQCLIKKSENIDTVIAESKEPEIVEFKPTSGTGY